MLIFGDCINFEFKNETLILESIELFINDIGELFSDIKLTFLDLHKGDRESHSILEVEPIYITPKKITKMNNLYEFISDLIETALDNS